MHFNWFKKLGLSYKILLTNILVCAIVWLLLDNYQSKHLRQVFLDKSYETLEHNAINDRHLFDRHIQGIFRSIKIITHQKKFLDYINNLKPINEPVPVVATHISNLPEWMPPTSVLRTFYNAPFALLFDEKNFIRSIYHHAGKHGDMDGLPEEIIRPSSILRKLSHNQAYMTLINETPYLISSENINLKNGQFTLALVSPINNQFLSNAVNLQQHETTIALINEASNKVLFSSDTKKIPPNSDINELKKDYLLTGKSFFDYGASDLRLQFASFISKSDATKITDHILSINNYQRMILVIIMLLTFSIIMLAFTKRLTALRQNVINYSTNELGSCTEDLIQGDELTILEKQFEKLVGEIKTSQQQLQRSQRMDAMGQLTGGVAHDFNNILAAILGFSQLAQKKYGKTPGLEKLDDYLLEIIIAGERGRDLVSAMLTYCRGEVGDEKTFSIADEINTAISMLRPTTPTSINISTNIGPDNEDISIKADPVRFSQVIINMIINARDEMENEIGLINITIKPSSFISGHCASCNSEFSGNYIELCISDTGKGIDPEIITRIFEPFYTTKKTGQGTGMGLSILHGFIHASGGHISVDSKPGSGSRFKLLLPQVAQEIAAAPDHESHDQSHTSTRPARLLIIDDETAITKLLHEVFEQHNYAVTSFNEPNEALAYFKRDPDNFDLVITDQSMPNLTGKELVLEALKTRPGIPIIMCSGYSAMINEASALELGISMYMEKPLQIDKLLDAVAQLINKQKD